MPLTLAVPTPNPLVTAENTMEATLALKTVKTIPTLTLVHGVPVNSNAPAALIPARQPALARMAQARH